MELQTHTAADMVLSINFPAELKDTELAFCRHMASGQAPTVAYMSAQRDSGIPIDKPSAARRAVCLLDRPEIIRYLDDLRKQMELHSVATGAAMMAYLSAAIFTPISLIDDNSPLCTKKTVTTHTHKDGSSTETVVYESVNKMQAVTQLSRMKGLDAPIKIDHNHQGGVMIIPATQSVDEWSKSIADSQAELMDDAINI